jgi:dolichol-phosphate mannosyltransferase
VGAAFRTGRDAAVTAGVDYLIHLDSDGHILPEEIPLVFDPVRSNTADLALRSRFQGGSAPENMARWKAAGLHSVARGVGLATGYHLNDMSCGFRCMNRRVLEAVRPAFDFSYIQETLIQALAAGARVVDVPVTALYEREPERTGLSGKTLRYSARFFGLTAYAMANFYRARARSLSSRGRPAGR